MSRQSPLVRRFYPLKPGLYICLFGVPIRNHMERERQKSKQALKQSTGPPFFNQSIGPPSFTCLASNITSFPLGSVTGSSSRNVAPLLINPGSESMPHLPVSADAVPIPADFPLTFCATWDEIIGRWRHLFYWETTPIRDVADFGRSVEKFLGIHGFLLTDSHGCGYHCQCPHQRLVRRLSTDAGHDHISLQVAHHHGGTMEVPFHVVSYAYFSKYFNSFGFYHLEPFEQGNDREAVAIGEVWGLDHGVRHGSQMTLAERNLNPGPHIQETQSDSWTAVLRLAKNKGPGSLSSHCEERNMISILHCIPRLKNIAADRLARSGKLLYYAADEATKSYVISCFETYLRKSGTNELGDEEFCIETIEGLNEQMTEQQKASRDPTRVRYSKLYVVTVI